MANNLEYVLSLNDKMSANLARIGISSTNALNKFAGLEKQTKDTQKLMNDMGGSVGALRAKLDLLRAEKEWIPSTQINAVRKYNTEIKSLEKEILRLDTINGSSLKRNLKDAISNVPYSEFITNPVTLAGAALVKAGSMALNFDEGMAKINTTANLSDQKLGGLKQTLLSIGTDAGADLSLVPEAFEKILSQTGDVTLSQDILKQALKGSKAGFTDQTVVADALSQSLSLIGKENTNAQEVMDVFFAAKRIGAGEFKDFAAYMPGLIASGKSLGVNFKETAGMFAYMTGKGQSAERATTLMENAFSAISKTDIQKNLKGTGIQIFDKNGSMRDMGVIFSEMQKKMASMSDEGKSNFLAKMGISDKEARSAFVILASDAKKLSQSIKEVSNSEGEAQKAFQKSRNAKQKIAEIMSKIQNVSIALGGVIATVLTPVLDGLVWVVGHVADGFAWLIDGFAKGTPLFYAGAFGIAAVTIALNAATISLKLQNFWLNVLIFKERVIGGLMKAKAFITGIVTGATTLWSAAQGKLNVVLMANPIGAVILLVVALIAVVVYLVSRIEGWGNLWDNTMKAMGAMWDTIVGSLYVGWLFFQNGLLNGIDLIMIGWYKLKGLWDEDGSKKGLAGIQKKSNARQEEYIAAKKKVGASAQAYAKYDQAASNSLSFNNDSLSDTANKFKKKLGIDNNSQAKKDKVNKGIAPAQVLNTKDLSNQGMQKDMQKNQASVSSGGSKQTTINMTFKNIVESISVAGKDFKESATNLQDQTTDAIVRALAMATSTAG